MRTIAIWLLLISVSMGQSYFGQDEILGSSWQPSADQPRGNRLQSGQYTASANDYVDSIYFYGRYLADSGSVKMAIYSTDGNIPDSKAGESDWLELTGSNIWNVVSVNISLTASTEYTVALLFSQTGYTYGADSTNGLSNDDGTTFPDTWNESFTTAKELTAYARVMNSGGEAPKYIRVRKTGG